MSTGAERRLYSGRKWRRFRAQIVARDSWLCQWCLKRGKTVAGTEVHHLETVKDAPSLIYCPSNVILLCHACHENTKPRAHVPEAVQAWAAFVDRLEA